MVIPSLIIGVGGTGQWVAACAKREFLNMGRGDLPPAVRLLVFDTAQRLSGPYDSTRAGPSSLLETLDEPGEYCYLGENIVETAQEVLGRPQPHITTWFQAQQHAAILSRSDFRWGQAAASFRQLGRLVLFQDVASPVRSQIYALLSDAIERIRVDSGEGGLQILIAASLVGTSGSGMIIDLAYLARRLAQMAGLHVTLRGFLLLPEAFRDQVDAGSLPAMRARAYAVLRELRRLSSDVNYPVGGIPFVYHAGGDDPLWHSRLEGPLFDSVYLLDGQRSNLPLCDLPLGHGLAPCLADTIRTLVDPQASQPVREHKLNMQGFLQEQKRLGALPPDAAAFGALGTYTIILPIQSMIRGWSLRLALELLDVLLKPPERDSQMGPPTELATNANQEKQGQRGRDEASDFLSSTHVPDPSDSHRGVDLTLWMAHVGRMAAPQADGGQSTVTWLRQWELDDWLRIFEPPGHGDDSTQLREQIALAFRTRLTEPDVVMTHDRTARESLAESAARIAGQVRDFKDANLGIRDTVTGQYVGGRCRSVLDQTALVHQRRFELALSFYLSALLNGQSVIDVRRSKGGKLGYVHDFLFGLANDLERALRVLRTVQSGRSPQPRQRLEMRALADYWLKEMRRSAARKSLLGRQQLAKAQKHYLEHEQALVDIQRVDVLYQVLADSVSGMLQHVQNVSSQVVRWIESLALGQHSIYGELQRQQRQLEKDRAAQKEIVVRWTIHDPSFEDERYRAYACEPERDAVDCLLDGLVWKLQPHLRLVWRGPKGEKATPARSGPAELQNIETLLALCRPFFEEALSGESVLGYLRYVYPDAGELADRINTLCGVALGHRAPHPLRANYLRVSRARSPEEMAYLESWLQRLAQLASRSVGEGGRSQRFAYVIYSEDRFQCSLIHTEELLPLETVEAYGSLPREDYWHYRQEHQIRGLDRRFLHILPAEVNAARYEDRLQPRRFLAPEVVVQLEHLDRMRLFLMAYLYGLVDKDVRQHHEGVYTLWLLKLPPGRDRDRWLLTPERRTGQLLEALTTFGYVGQDRERPHEYKHPIPYGRVGETVTQLRQADARHRVEAGIAGEQIGHRRRLVQALVGRERETALLAAARVDRLQEDILRLQREIEDWQATPIQAEARQMADLLSVFILMLREEIAESQARIQEQILIGMGGTGPLALG